MSYDFTPQGRGQQPVHKDVTYEFEQVSRGQDREGPGDALSPRRSAATCWTSWRPSRSAASRWPTSSKGYISTASCILANISMQLGRTLAWDPAKGQVVGDDEANRLLRRPYRAPWVHPEPGKYA